MKRKSAFNIKAKRRRRVYKRHARLRKWRVKDSVERKKRGGELNVSC